MTDDCQHPAGQAPSEAERLSRLADYGIVGAPPDASFDDIVRLAAALLKAPIALLCIADAACHWIKSRIGMDVVSVPRDISFCDHTLAHGDVFIVLDAGGDPRFRNGPFVAGPEHVRFYLGIPLEDADGYQIGTICVLDRAPRERVTAEEIDAIRSLARITVDRLELRRHSAYLAEAQRKAEAAEQEAKTAHERLREAIDIVPEALVFMDAEDRFVLWNRRYAELFPDIAPLLKPGIGYDDLFRAGLRSRDGERLRGYWAGEPAEDGDGAGPSHLREHLFADGRWIRYDERRTSDGGSVGIRVDITDLKRREASVKLLFDRNPVPLWLCDAATLRVIAVNDATLQLYGYTRAQALALSLPDVAVAGPAAVIDEVARQAAGADSPRPQRHHRAEGAPIDVLPFIRSIAYEDRPALLVAVVDVTERLRAEARIKHLAHHDVLTDLPNRALFHERLAEALAEARASDGHVALCLVDLDRFKVINDTLGHAAGDAVLRVVARRLARIAGPGGTVARLGGDEFAIVFAGLARAADAGALLAEVTGIFRDPIVHNGEVIPIAGSAGAAIGPVDGAEPSLLMQNADVALYRSKATGRNRVTLFDQEMRAKMVRLNLLVGRFRQALRERELVPYYQPVVNLHHFTIRGYEALVRWRHPERGLIEAGAFAEVFDNPELAVDLGAYMIEAVTRDMRAWLDAGIDFGAIAVNVTAADLRSEGFAERVLDALARRSLAPNRLIVEATENSLVERDNDTVAKVLNTLDQRGVYIALDDFGTGHSSLVHLRALNVATLKIDQSFVRDMVSDHEDAAIVRGLAMLARNLQIATVAEGIENEEQVRMLVEAGCHYGQGFLFGRPMPAEHVPFFSAHRKARPEPAALAPAKPASRRRRRAVA